MDPHHVLDISEQSAWNPRRSHRSLGFVKHSEWSKETLSLLFLAGQVEHQGAVWLTESTENIQSPTCNVNIHHTEAQAPSLAVIRGAGHPNYRGIWKMSGALGVFNGNAPVSAYNPETWWRTVDNMVNQQQQQRNRFDFYSCNIWTAAGGECHMKVWRHSLFVLLGDAS